MNRRDAKIRAHQVAHLLIRQYLDTGEGAADTEADADKIEVALIELADSHYRSAQRMMGAGDHRG